MAPGGAAAKLRSEAVWPADAVTHVRRTYEAWDWRTLDFGARNLTVVRQAAGVDVTATGSDERFILVLRNVMPTAVLRLSPSRPLQGVLIDAMTGRTITVEDCAARPGEMCGIGLPAGYRILLLAMR
jgi:hypothetical protein